MLARGLARRRAALFIDLLAITLVLMAFSSSPAVLDVQRGLNVAFRPIQGALDDLAGSVASAARAIGEIDALRTDNARLSA